MAIVKKSNEKNRWNIERGMFVIIFSLKHLASYPYKFKSLFWITRKYGNRELSGQSNKRSTRNRNFVVLLIFLCVAWSRKLRRCRARRRNRRGRAGIVDAITYRWVIHCESNDTVTLLSFFREIARRKSWLNIHHSLSIKRCNPQENRSTAFQFLAFASFLKKNQLVMITNTRGTITCS